MQEHYKSPTLFEVTLCATHRRRRSETPDLRASDKILTSNIGFCTIGGTLFQLFGMPFVLRDFGTRAAWLLLPIMLLQPLHWGLIHEAIHSPLLPDRRTNEFCAQIR